MTAADVSSLVAAVVALVAGITAYIKVRPGPVSEVGSELALLRQRIDALEKGVEQLRARLKP